MIDLSSRARAIAALIGLPSSSSDASGALSAALDLVGSLIHAGEGAEALALLDAMEVNPQSDLVHLQLKLHRIEALSSLGRFRDALAQWERLKEEAARLGADAPRSLLLRATILA